jgi:CRISPR system Cascade subunit CasE
MYLSRLILNPRIRRVQRELANPYELHRTLMSAFHTDLPAQERVLYRLEVDARTGVPSLLLQSHTRPDWAWLGNPGARDYLTQAPETKAFELTFSPGQTLAFRLRANPTVKRWLPGDKEKPDSEKKPMRVAITGEEALGAWLDRKAVQGGFRLLRVAIREEGDLTARQPRKNSDVGETTEETIDTGGRVPRRKLTFRAICFEGALEVVDPDLLWQTVRQGIGPGKSFGFGLLSLARA